MSGPEATERIATEVAALVLAAVAEAGGLERDALTAETPLLDANVDSLTLVAIVAHAELAFDLCFTDEEAAALVEARDLGELCALVARKVAGARGGESR